jgi:hypothetical protein
VLFDEWLNWELLLLITPSKSNSSMSIVFVLVPICMWVCQWVSICLSAVCVYSLFLYGCIVSSKNLKSTKKTRVSHLRNIYGVLVRSTLFFHFIKSSTYGRGRLRVHTCRSSWTNTVCTCFLQSKNRHLPDPPVCVQHPHFFNSRTNKVLAITDVHRRSSNARSSYRVHTVRAEYMWAETPGIYTVKMLIK